MYDNEEMLHKLFDVVRYYTLQSCGDGDGYIVSDEYEKLANIFELYEASLPDKWFLERHNDMNYIWFAHEQEYICFTDIRDKARSYSDITVMM